MKKQSEKILEKINKLKFKLIELIPVKAEINQLEKEITGVIRMKPDPKDGLF